MSSFNYKRFQEDLAELNNRSFRQCKLIYLPADGTANGGTQGVGQFDVPMPGFFPCNSIVLLQRSLNADRARLASTLVGRLYLEVNDNGQKIGMSLIPNSGDITNLAGTFRSCKFSIPTADLGVNGTFFIFALLLGISVGSAGAVGGSSSGGGGGYIVAG